MCSKLTIKTPFSSVSVVDFEQVSVSLDVAILHSFRRFL